MAQKATDIVLDFALEHYVTSTKVSRVNGRDKKIRVTRSQLSKDAAQNLLKYLTNHGMTEDEAVSHITRRFNVVLTAQTKAPFGLRRKSDNTLLYLVCGVVLMLGGAAGLFAASNKTLYGFILLMGAMVLWTGLDPLPRAMTKFWREYCQDFDGMTLADLEALHELVVKTARKNSLDQ
ncbi:MAG: hypothetical protein IJ507_06790 [Clostridia bacterium]|nr:hypothetical protein [Clostridia bacterium]